MSTKESTSKPDVNALNVIASKDFFAVDSDDESSEDETQASEDEAKCDTSSTKQCGISQEDAEIVLDEYRSARTSGLPPPNIMFAASKKPGFLKASNVASKWDGEKQLNDFRAAQARKTTNPDIISAAAVSKDDWDDDGDVKRVKNVHNVSEEDQKRHLSIEQQIREDAKRIKSDRRLRVLLLGTGESGKTTFIKQIKIIYGNGFSNEEKVEFRTHIYLNVIRGIKVLVDAMRKLGIPYTEPTNAQYTDLVIAFTDYPDATMFRDFASVVKRLWSDAAVKRVAEYGGKYFQFTESVKLFFDDIDRISAINYLPSESDIVLARKPTKNIAEYTCIVERYEINFIDVGGQRSERRKWLSAFTGLLHSILFMVATSEFDEVLFEAGCDDRPNRIREALGVFRLIINNRFLVERVAPIIFFNKHDLLCSKVINRIANIQQNFPDFRGDPYNIEHVQAYFIDIFRQARTYNSGKPFYYHFTTAIDTNNVKRVFDSIKHTIIQQRLSEFGLQ